MQCHLQCLLLASLPCRPCCPPTRPECEHSSSFEYESATFERVETSECSSQNKPTRTPLKLSAKQKVRNTVTFCKTKSVCKQKNTHTHRHTGEDQSLCPSFAYDVSVTQRREFFLSCSVVNLEHASLSIDFCLLSIRIFDRRIKTLHEFTFAELWKKKKRGRKKKKKKKSSFSECDRVRELQHRGSTKSRKAKQQRKRKKKGDKKRVALPERREPTYRLLRNKERTRKEKEKERRKDETREETTKRRAKQTETTSACTRAPQLTSSPNHAKLMI